jgi:UDP-3-O-[3-hydroxymyristoyl] glucosamine N-acyltransferase
MKGDYVFTENRWFDSDETLPNGATVGKNSMICAGVVLGRQAKIGTSTFVDRKAVIRGTLGNYVKIFPNVAVYCVGSVDDSSEVGDSCIIEGDVGKRCIIGDFSHILRGTFISDGTNVGMNQTK